MYGLIATTIFGGVPQSRQVNALRGAVYTVIDEADHMADLGFLPCITLFLSSPRTPSADDENSPVVDMTHHTEGRLEGPMRRMRLRWFPNLVRLEEFPCP